MSTATSARALLMIADRVLTHGPTPSLLVRVITTRAPSRRRSARRSRATLKLNWASVYPPSVVVPVVSQVSHPVPFQISWPIVPGSLKFPPLWPGSMPMIFPASGSAAGLGDGLAEAVAPGVVTGGGAEGRAGGRDAERLPPAAPPGAPQPRRASPPTARAAPASQSGGADPARARANGGKPGRPLRSVISTLLCVKDTYPGRPSRRGYRSRAGADTRSISPSAGPV